VVKGCPEEKILLPQLWDLVMDEPTRQLNVSGCYTLGYTDNIAILITEKFPDTIS
jgi:hypothetical protein